MYPVNSVNLKAQGPREDSSQIRQATHRPYLTSIDLQVVLFQLQGYFTPLNQSYGLLATEVDPLLGYKLTVVEIALLETLVSNADDVQRRKA